ncbi:cytochrome c oxidase assembly protein [Peribacillus sp. SCS-37]|uniref:cytochrome c oxidase assembly protein n=1 Tax=Paraperibacillus esterisolvens TaxID=3115296 RepID=UPI003906B834
MKHDHHRINGGEIMPDSWLIPEILLAALFIAGLLLYAFAAYYSSRRYKSWPWRRIFNFAAGSLCALAAVTGPLADLSHTDFRAHMAGHVLLGMLAPLLMVTGAPMTLLLRSLSTSAARRLTSFLKGGLPHLFFHPVFAAVLNLGGLWVLYATPLFSVMHKNIFLYFIVHLHIFWAGFLFTAAIIYIDPVHHRTSPGFRTAVLILFMAGHSILSKYLYAHPPGGVPAEEAETGGMIMYYAGDVIDAVIIVILCFQWYRAARPSAKMAPAK